MIDTVRLICKARPTSAQLKEYWQNRESTKPGCETKSEYYYHPAKPEDLQVRATYRPKNLDPGRGVNASKILQEEAKAALEDQFCIEFSFPKLLFGNNHEMILDLKPAIDVADCLLPQVPAFPVLPSLYEWTLSRLDVCYNYFVGPLVPEYIALLSLLDYPHRDTIRVNAETVAFRSKSATTTYYNKAAESGMREAEGLLRHESTFRRARPIKAAFHRAGTLYLADVTRERCRAVLETDLKRLGILGLPLGTFNNALAALTDAYGPARATRLFGILTLYQHYGRSDIATKLGQTRNFVNRSLRDIRNAGLSLTLAKSEYPLPPLEVDL